jgi:hypothetical protein
VHVVRPTLIALGGEARAQLDVSVGAFYADLRRVFMGRAGPWPRQGEAVRRCSASWRRAVAVPGHRCDQ